MSEPDEWLPDMRIAHAALMALPRQQRGEVLVWFCSCGNKLEPCKYEPCDECEKEMQR